MPASGVVSRFSLKIKQQNLCGFFGAYRQRRLGNDHDTIALLGLLAINRDRSARNLNPAIPVRIHRALNFLTAIEYRSKQTHILIQSH